MQKYNILLSLAAVASARGCCTIYSQTNMQGESQQLCYDSSDAYLRTTTTYVLSDLDIDWSIASISCDTDEDYLAGYTVCNDSDDSDSCGQKSFFPGYGWMSYGDNSDLTDVDIPVIGISNNGRNGEAVTVYESDDCTGPSMSEPMLFKPEYSSLQISRNLIQTQSLMNGTESINAQVNQLASIRVPSFLSVDLYKKIGQSGSPFDTIVGADDTCFSFNTGYLKSLRVYSN